MRPQHRAPFRRAQAETLEHRVLLSGDPLDGTGNPYLVVGALIAAGIAEVFLIGLLFSWLLWRTGSLRVALFCHALYNSLIVLVLRHVPRGSFAISAITASRDRAQMCSASTSRSSMPNSSIISARRLAPTSLQAASE